MSKMILIADDNENDLVALENILRRVGLKNPVTTVSDGEGVIAYFKGQHQYADRVKFPIPSVLLLDLKMPRVEGFTVMEWLKKNYPLKNTLLVVLTGQGELQYVKQAYALGASSFLTKPCEEADIINLINGFPRYWEYESREAKSKKRRG